MDMERAPQSDPPASADRAVPSAAPRIAPMDGGAPLDLRTVRALQRSAGNRRVGKLLSRGPLQVARAPAGTELLVSEAAQASAAPLLESMKVDSAGASALFRGDMVVGEVANPGKTGTIVFFQLKENRLRAGIFSINVKDDPSAALRAFGRFRGAARTLARALQVPEMELMGAAVANPNVEAMLTSQGFVKATEPLPESLGALPGESIEVFAKRFPVASAAATSEVAPTVTEAAEVASATRVSGAGAVGLGARVAIVAVETIILAVIMLALEYLRRRAEAQRFEDRMRAAQPEIESAAAALESEATTLQGAAGGRTVWAHITIWITSHDTVTSAMGFPSYDHAFDDAGFEHASAGLDYRQDRSSTLGQPMTWPHQYGSSTFTPRRELVTYSVPIPYDAVSLDPPARALRIRHLEEDASRPGLSPPVLQALFNERETLLRAGAAAEPVR
jgi:hypothetical protein